MKRDQQIRNLCMVSGVAHMVAIDDGTNSAYAADGGGGFPVLHAAARRQGMITLYEDGLRKVAEGQTSMEEVLRVTGYPRGAVSPFGLPQPLRTLADPGIFEPDEISIGSGVRGTTVILSSADLHRALPEVEIVALKKTGSN